MTSEQTKKSRVETAIAQWHLLGFVYDGQARVLEPHTFGIDSTGQPALCGYQVSGGSRSGQVHGWKTLRLDKLDEPKVLPRSFHRPRPEYKRDDPAFDTIWAQL
jgi:hypothetical protein